MRMQQQGKYAVIFQFLQAEKGNPPGYRPWAAVDQKVLYYKNMQHSQKQGCHNKKLDAGNRETYKAASLARQ